MTLPPIPVRRLAPGMEHPDGHRGRQGLPPAAYAAGGSVNFVIPHLPGLDLCLLLQAVTLNGGNIVGGTNLNTIKIKF